MASNAPDLNAKVLKQIEYYFGDVNLQRDKFLQDHLKLDHGWVPIDVLLTFNRLKQITEDKSAIAAALKDSNLVDVSEDNEKVRRNPEVPIPENSLEFWQEVKTRTVYVKGFPPETTLDDIMDYLKPYGAIANVVMRRLKESKAFKGSIFATFKEKEAAENFVKNEEAQKYRDVELTRMMQNDYWSKKVADTKEKKAARKALKQQKNAEARENEDDASQQPRFKKRKRNFGKGRGKKRGNKEATLEPPAEKPATESEGTTLEQPPANKPATESEGATMDQPTAKKPAPDSEGATMDQPPTKKPATESEGATLEKPPEGRGKKRGSEGATLEQPQAKKPATNSEVATLEQLPEGRGKKRGSEGAALEQPPAKKPATDNGDS